MIYRIIFVCLCLLALSSCSATRVTTTEHSAVEQALLTYASRKAFSSVKLTELKNRKVFIDKVVLPNRFPRTNLGNNTNWHEINPKYLKALLEKNLLKAGAYLTEEKEQSEVVLKLICDVVAIDDSDFIMGIPSIPVPLSTGTATLQTPEISLFSSKKQTGKVRFSIYGKDRATGGLAFYKKSDAARKYYSRWSMLIVLGWRITDLGAPF